MNEKFSFEQVATVESALLTSRFLPAIDRHIDVFFSRDLDSRINDREAAAVKEFLASDESDLHVMRDHPGKSHHHYGGR